MERLNVTIRIEDPDDTKIPLQRNFVEHIVWGVPVGLFITDDEGRVRDEDGNLGIETDDERIDIRVLLQNSVVKHQDALSWKEFRVADGDEKQLTDVNTEHWNKFRVLNHCVTVYDKVFRQFEIFSSRGDFPLFRSGVSLETKKNSLNRIGLDYPSAFPFATLSFTEPKAMFSDRPVLHIFDNEPRLFGTDGEKRTAIASELAHGLHFSDLTIFQREGIQNTYLWWLIGQSSSGANPTHGIVDQTTGNPIITTPLIAFLESLDQFSSRFFAFVLANPNDVIDNTFRNRFIESELNSGEFCTFNGDLHTGVVTNPVVTGPSNEGAVYAALFLDFARRPGIGLKSVVNAFFISKALTMEDFSRWMVEQIRMEHKPELIPSFTEVVNTWGMGPLADSSINSMEMEITCIHKVPRGDRYHHIESVGGIDHTNGTSFKIKQEWCISFINGGANFFVQGPNGRVPVRVITRDQPGVGRTTYIATEADETESDNLLSLPEC